MANTTDNVGSTEQNRSSTQPRSKVIDAPTDLFTRRGISTRFRPQISPGLIVQAEGNRLAAVGADTETGGSSSRRALSSGNVMNKIGGSYIGRVQFRPNDTLTQHHDLGAKLLDKINVVSDDQN